MSSQPTIRPTDEDINQLNDFLRIARGEERNPMLHMRGFVDPVCSDVSKLFGKKFQPPYPNATPISLFLHGPIRITSRSEVLARTGGVEWIFPNRFWGSSSRKDMLIYTDGACLNNGQANPTAGCAFVFRPEFYEGTSFRLENHGPDKLPHAQTSNRAELRAVIGALQYRSWGGENVDRLIIATDSEYVVKGATEWAKSWERKNWVTAKNLPVKNRDLWELLLEQIRKHGQMGLEILFWAIPRELNVLADAAAKKAALEDECSDFSPLYGFFV